MIQGWKRWLGFLLTGLLASFSFSGEWPPTAATASDSMQSRRTAKLSFPEIRLRLLARFENIFYCPPPVERPVDGPVPDIRDDVAAFHIILSHLGLKDSDGLSQDRRLAIYREYQKMRAIRLDADRSNYRFTLDVREKDGDFRIDGTVDGEGGIKVLQQERAVFNCPKCLAADTRIETPVGLILVQDLKPGDQVWTLDLNGNRVSAAILRTAAISVSLEHRMIHLALKDGREIWVSPGHPTIDRRTFAQLRKGTLYDGSTVLIHDTVAYTTTKTYDLLPSGDTGFYWANGILLASTMR